MSVGVIGLALGFVSTAFQAVSSYQAYSYQAKVAEMNQEIANDNATRALERAQVEQQDQDSITLAMLGEQEAQQAASGLAFGSGSFRLARKSARELGRKDALNIRQAGELEAYDYRTQAANFGAHAEMAKASATNSLLGGFLSGTASLVSGATKVANPDRFANPYYDQNLMQ
jgi:hypothetical protein